MEGQVSGSKGLLIYGLMIFDLKPASNEPPRHYIFEVLHVRVKLNFGLLHFGS